MASLADELVEVGEQGGVTKEPEVKKGTGSPTAESTSESTLMVKLEELSDAVNALLGWQKEKQEIGSACRHSSIQR